MYYDNNIVALGEPIRLELADAFFHFCYHPERKEHIKIDTPARLEADAKYVVTVSNYHWICKRNVTVVALPAYANQRAQVARNNLKIAIKEAPTEEAKITEHRCYINLVETILKGIMDISNSENPTVSTREQIDLINIVVEFIRTKHIRPSWMNNGSKNITYLDVRRHQDYCIQGIKELSTQHISTANELHKN